MKAVNNRPCSERLCVCVDPPPLHCMCMCKLSYIQGTGWTALFFAANAGYPTVFKELLSKGATPEIECVSLRNYYKI